MIFAHRFLFTFTLNSRFLVLVNVLRLCAQQSSLGLGTQRFFPAGDGKKFRKSKTRSKRTFPVRSWEAPEEAQLFSSSMVVLVEQAFGSTPQDRTRFVASTDTMMTTFSRSALRQLQLFYCLPQRGVFEPPGGDESSAR